MEKFDRLSSLVFFFLSLAICVESLRLSVGTLRHPGSGFFTFAAGASSGILSLILYIKNRQRGKDYKKFWEVEANKRYIFITMGVLIIYSLLLEVLGFLFPTILFFFCILRFVSLQRSRIAFPLSIFISVLGFVIFDIWFQSQLPRGILERGLLWIFGKMWP